MLINLHVKNLALIDEEEIGFGQGLNILSGETGAGKSIILGALSLALGEKGSTKMLRDEAKDGLVEAVFEVSSDGQKAALEALDIPCYDDEVILTRRITSSRLVSRINGETVPAQKMKQAGAVLLDIYGQNEHQSLLSKKKHLSMLDSYAKKEVDLPKAAMKAAYENYRSKAKELEDASLDESERARELSFLEHEISEIEEAQLAPGEDERLEEEYRRMKHASRIAEALNTAHDYLTAENGACDLVGAASNEVTGVSAYDENLNGILSALSDADSLLDDLRHEISGYMDSLEFDPEYFNETEMRLDLINTLKMKYGKTIDDILLQLQEKKARYEQLTDFDSYVAKLSKEVKALESTYLGHASKVTELRKKAAAELCEKVKGALIDLNFLDVKFTMNFTLLEKGSANGRDEAEFYISTNPGEPLRPLKDVASGGELSRIMLAMKTVFAQKEDTIDTLIFDEIDAGISGRTAQAVSEKLHAVSRSQQVICITHLPQIASMADTHFLIEKSVQNNKTVSGIRKLSREESIEELARMLAGGAVTDSVLANAREMYELAHSEQVD